MYKQMNLKDIIKETSTPELLRASKTNKEYFYFNISVFNVGVNISIKCTNKYKEPNYKTWNGYDFIIENDYFMNELIENELNNRRTLIN
jgi:hypothetical protein